MKKVFLVFAFLCVALNSISAAKKQEQKMVLIETSMGDIKIVLYDETPLHRDNFLKLVEENFYDGILFHRVIKDFMIQGGDPYSKSENSGLQLGTGGVGYTVPAEIVFPKYYHKRGALAAARQADFVNPEKASSGCQFYIVKGRNFSDDELDMLETRVSQGLSTQEKFRYSEEQRRIYKTFGGTPHLDGQYTVFGEVIEGFDVLQKISEVATGKGDRPVEDVKILKMKIVKH